MIIIKTLMTFDNVFIMGIFNVRIQNLIIHEYLFCIIFLSMAIFLVFQTGFPKTLSARQKKMEKVKWFKTARALRAKYEDLGKSEIGLRKVKRLQMVGNVYAEERSIKFIFLTFKFSYSLYKA